MVKFSSRAPGCLPESLGPLPGREASTSLHRASGDVTVSETESFCLPRLPWSQSSLRVRFPLSPCPGPQEDPENECPLQGCLMEPVVAAPQVLAQPQVPGCRWEPVTLKSLLFTLSVCSLVHLCNHSFPYPPAISSTQLRNACAVQTQCCPRGDPEMGQVPVPRNSWSSHGMLREHSIPREPEHCVPLPFLRLGCSEVVSWGQGARAPQPSSFLLLSQRLRFALPVQALCGDDQKARSAEGGDSPRHPESQQLGQDWSPACASNPRTLERAGTQGRAACALDESRVRPEFPRFVCWAKQVSDFRDVA